MAYREMNCGSLSKLLKFLKAVLGSFQRRNSKLISLKRLLKSGVFKIQLRSDNPTKNSFSKSQQHLNINGGAEKFSAENLCYLALESQNMSRGAIKMAGMPMANGHMALALLRFLFGSSGQQNHWHTTKTLFNTTKAFMHC